MFRPGRRAARSIVVSVSGLLCGGIFVTGGGFALAQPGQTRIGAVQIALGVAFAAVSSLAGWAYFVAIDDQFVTMGRIGRSSDETVPRRDISYVTWIRRTNTPHGVLHGADGRPLAEIAQWISEEDVARIAQHLGIPFRPEPRRRPAG